MPAPTRPCGGDARGCPARFRDHTSTWRASSILADSQCCRRQTENRCQTDDDEHPINNNPSSERGGIAKSSVSASKRQFRRTVTFQSIPATKVRIVLMWPCSQRSRCVTEPSAEDAKWLIARAVEQNNGGCPASASSRPSLRSSTIQVG
jgi:hypothetical protein